MSYKFEVNTYGDAPGVYSSNAITYETSDEATEAAKNLFGRWTAVKLWRVVEVDTGKVTDTNESLDDIAANTLAHLADKA